MSSMPSSGTAAAITASDGRDSHLGSAFTPGWQEPCALQGRRSAQVPGTSAPAQGGDPRPSFGTMNVGESRTTDLLEIPDPPKTPPKS